MATLYKQPNSPFYYAQYFNADGKRVAKTTSTTKKREAQRIAAKFEADERDIRNKSTQLPKQFAVVIETVTREAATGHLTLARAEEFVHRLHKLANPDFQEASLAEFWAKWITEQRRHVGISTAQGYGQDRDLFAVALGKKIMAAPVNALTSDQIDKAIDKAKKKGDRRASTINKALASLRRVMAYAVAKELATHNPAKQSRTLKQKDSIKRAPFTVPELRSLLDHKDTTDEWKGAITIAAHTGLRMGDISILSRKHIDGDRLFIVQGKTDHIDEEKIVTIPLTPPCLAWIAGRKGYFFPKLKAQNPATTSMQFTAIMKKAGVPKQIEIKGGLKRSRSFHALRHTFSSWLAEADVHADVRQKLTGHSSSKIHQGYIHHDEALDRAVASLPSL